MSFYEKADEVNELIEHYISLTTLYRLCEHAKLQMEIEEDSDFDDKLNEGKDRENNPDYILNTSPQVDNTNNGPDMNASELQLSSPMALDRPAEPPN